MLAPPAPTWNSDSSEFRFRRHVFRRRSHGFEMPSKLRFTRTAVGVRPMRAATTSSGAVPSKRSSARVQGGIAGSAERSGSSSTVSPFPTYGRGRRQEARSVEAPSLPQATRPVSAGDSPRDRHELRRVLDATKRWFLFPAPPVTDGFGREDPQHLQVAHIAGAQDVLSDIVAGGRRGHSCTLTSSCRRGRSALPRLPGTA